MNISDWLQKSVDALDQAGIATARLDALLLLEDLTGKNRAHILAHSEYVLSAEQQNRLSSAVQRRLTHEPLAYIRGTAEFYGRSFTVNQHVLVPRPESESIITLLKQHVPIDKACQIIDIGTGSGALAITAALELPQATVTAIDIDPACLEVTAVNAAQHHAQVQVIQSDLLENYPLPATPSPLYILANLPYVPNTYPVNTAATHEPRLALYGGDDGLDLYRQLFWQLQDLASCQAFVLTESLPSQHPALKNIAASHTFAHVAEESFIQIFKNT